MCDSCSHNTEDFKGDLPTQGAVYKRLPYHGSAEGEDNFIMFRKEWKPFEWLYFGWRVVEGKRVVEWEGNMMFDKNNYFVDNKLWERV